MKKPSVDMRIDAKHKRGNRPLEVRPAIRTSGPDNPPVAVGRGRRWPNAENSSYGSGGRARAGLGIFNLIPRCLVGGRCSRQHCTSSPMLGMIVGASASHQLYCQVGETVSRESGSQIAESYQRRIAVCFLPSPLLYAGPSC